MSHRFDAIEAVLEERARHDARWGGAGSPNDVCYPWMPNGVRLRVLAEEFGEVAEAMGRPEDGNGKRDLRTELIQVAAVALAWVEGLDGARCPDCSGDGFTAESDHAPGCDGTRCEGQCPVQIQAECRRCDGRGTLPEPRTAGMAPARLLHADDVPF